jgi:DNA primase
VLEGALPLVDVLWSREVESAPLDTPERRAALEKRIRERLSAVANEDLRRHYRAEMEVRLRALLPSSGFQRGQGGGYRGERPAWRFGEKRRPTGIPEPMRASESLARSPLFSGAGSLSPREALILMVLVAHPELLSGHAEMVAGLDLAHAESRRVRQALVDWDAAQTEPGKEAARDALERAGLVQELARLELAVHPGDRWCLDSGADPEEVRESLRQAITLHRRALTLHNELALAQSAFAQDASEANLAWIRDLRSQISALEGTEAELERAAPALDGG